MAAIAQSAVLLNGRYLYAQAPTTRDSGQVLATILGCDRAADVLAAMRAKTLDEILAAASGLPPNIFGPVTGDMTPKAWLSPHNEASWHDVPLIVSSTCGRR